MWNCLLLFSTFNTSYSEHEDGLGCEWRQGQEWLRCDDDDGNGNGDDDDDNDDYDYNNDDHDYNNDYHDYNNDDYNVNRDDDNDAEFNNIYFREI